MQQNTYEEYAIIDAKIAELEAQKAPLRVKILEEMVDRGEKKVETPFGSFSVSPRKTWTYTEKVSEAEEKFKALKAKEEGKEKVILFNFSGHGLMDLVGYNKYLNGELNDYEYPEEEIAKNLKKLEGYPMPK